ncbi:MAG: Asp-tRNA(Asn)/Glu-tRNA(Gln) amidotransferase subunit GatA, partial [Candidatus Sungiibacteriota bacterium]
MKLNELTIQEASAGIRKKDFSVSELVSACLNAVAGKDADIHAYLEIFEDAREEAKKRDEEIAAYSVEELQRLPPLFGIPLAIKDNILIAGRRCTAGSRMLENYVAPYDATVIRKLKKQGAVFLGRTNMDEFAMGGSTEHSAYGPTKNPRDLTRVPGGSSGGSAAAVAGDMCLGALGSDTGGSIRQPAAFCGIVGMKPTYGAVSRHGLITMAASLNQIGPMAKSVADTKILFDVISGADAFDAVAYEKRQIINDKSRGLKNFKIGVPREYFGAGLDAEVERTIRGALKQMEDAGAILVDISLPHASLALPAYYIIVPCEISADLARFDGIRYGHRAIDAVTLFDTYTRSRAEGFGAEVKRRIMLGTYALSAGYYDAYYVKAQKARALIRDDFVSAFAKVDIIVGPTTPTLAFAFGEHSRDPLSMYLADIYTVAANLAGLPALSLPAGNIAMGGI